MSDDLAHVLRHADECHGIVTRDGEMDACGKPPVAIIDGRDTEAEGYWPACAFHAHRYGRMRCVPIEQIIRAITEVPDRQVLDNRVNR